jgi:hypothetical protein
MKKYFILAFKTENDVPSIKRMYVNDEQTISFLNEGFLIYRAGEGQVGMLINNDLFWKDHIEEINT